LEVLEKWYWTDGQENDYDFTKGEFSRMDKIETWSVSTHASNSYMRWTRSEDLMWKEILWMFKGMLNQ
jgi:hypothetical protein